VRIGDWSSHGRRRRSAPSVTVHRITAFNGNVVAADFNGDGVIDVAATGSAVVDVNGDGRPDIVIANYTAHSVSFDDVRIEP